MKTYQISWVAILIIGVLLWFFEDLAQLLGVVIVVISIFALWKKKEKVGISVDTNKE